MALQYVTVSVTAWSIDEDYPSDTHQPVSSAVSHPPYISGIALTPLLGDMIICNISKVNLIFLFKKRSLIIQRAVEDENHISNLFRRMRENVVHMNDCSTTFCISHLR